MMRPSSPAYAVEDAMMQECPKLLDFGHSLSQDRTPRMQGVRFRLQDQPFCIHGVRFLIKKRISGVSAIFFRKKRVFCAFFS